MDIAKKLPIGIENFEEIRTEGFYYIDKTGLIKELLLSWGKVNLFTRPRRFGKSLNMSMLKCFFEIGQNRELFEGLAISEEKELCETYQGKFPVISISLKGVSGNDFETARSMLIAEIRREAQRFQFLIQSDKLTEIDKEIYYKLIKIEKDNQKMSNTILMNSILNLSILLQKHYNKKVIILVDEYDVPLDKAFQFGYYDAMINVMCNLFIQAFKSNDSLYFSVLTGCLRISKESIFTGLNNLKILSITNVRFDEYFGFTDVEVKKLLEQYNLLEYFNIVKSWYDGYLFGNVNVYCPWDVINYCDELCVDLKAEPKEYWSNTSNNNIVRRFIDKATKKTRNEIESLIAGEGIEKEIKEELTYSELDSTIDNLWSVLFITGYLTYHKRIEGNKYQLVIPNLEIRHIFISQVKEWFQYIVKKDSSQLDIFCNAFLECDEKVIEEQFNSYLMKTISIRDNSIRKEKKENFYHGILLGLLSHMEDWSIFSNAESGEGYSDILVEIEDKKIGIVIEVKYAENNKLEKAVEKALKQIETKQYTQVLVDDGMKKIIRCGVACYKKHCKVKIDIL